MIVNYFTPLTAGEPITDEHRAMEAGITKGMGWVHSNSIDKVVEKVDGYKMQ